MYNDKMARAKLADELGLNTIEFVAAELFVTECMERKMSAMQMLTLGMKNAAHKGDAMYIATIIGAGQERDFMGKKKEEE